MNKKRYKDFIATAILLGIGGLMFSIYLFAKYGTTEQKDLVVECLISLIMIVCVFAVWKAIRLIID